MRKHFFIDMETLGTSPDAVILSMAILCVPEITENFPLNEENFKRIMWCGKYWKLDRKSQMELDRKIDKRTVMWWNQQGAEAKEVLSNTNCVNPQTALMDLHQYCYDKEFNPKEDVVWSRRMIDSIWYSSLCQTYNVEPLLPYWCFRDTATALELVTGDTNGSKEINLTDTSKYFIKHNCLCDVTMDFFRSVNI